MKHKQAPILELHIETDPAGTVALCGEMGSASASTSCAAGDAPFRGGGIPWDERRNARIHLFWRYSYV